jgi:F-type H+-transporting ATPase subunit b
MELVKPSIGLIFWMVVSFSIILFLLKKFAWSPILNMVKEREESIDAALKSAEQAKAEMKSLKSENERILAEARNERDIMLKEARDIKEKIVSEAKAIATTEGERLLKAARENIENEKMAAITELKNQVAVLSIEIAEKILKAELASDDKQKSLVKNLLQDVNLN